MKKMAEIYSGGVHFDEFVCRKNYKISATLDEIYI